MLERSGEGANVGSSAPAVLRVVAEARALSKQLARDASAEEAPPIPMPSCNAGWHCTGGPLNDAQVQH